MMVRSIFGLFAKSPFPYIREMAHKVKECADEVPVLFDAVFEGDQDKVKAIAENISHLEHEVDVVKTRIRDSLPKTIFMSVDRRDLLDVLASLDAIADNAEDVGILFTLRKMEPHPELVPQLKKLLRRVMTTVDKAVEIVDALEVLADVSFTGPEAERVLLMIDELNRLEHEADLVQDALARLLFGMEDDIKPGSLLIWNKIFNKVGDMANAAEKMGNRLRLFMSK
ncbi:TIGR00153 family protein [Lujinxingia vulgaris]|uniref:TIGR00153 family protein n=2 Tax=Lujinxingia TaxID=2653226 RepID=A0A5C6XKL9_9DELT|nr:MULTISPECIES: TIGR00153 family protein [Lujinxingia]RDV38538.1 TIGR00153 family protein [Bradymonadaceae bacterium TMQ3]RVU44915.1 TIGR00153 family protein [Lujinxingia sediminis]TXC76694.1 TIGR00153 family protein [Bradymonadales bacterium TMQ1]TXD42950.1 TIGR00153 family protein [Lujinxingia vulgaris]